MWLSQIYVPTSCCFNFLVNVCFDQEDYMVNENEKELTIEMSLDESPPEDFIFTISDDPVGDASGKLCMTSLHMT